MSRYRGAKLRITRRLGELPGLTQKISANKQRPGQHGKTVKKSTEYGLRLEEKQKLKFNYGLTESQLYKYIKEARRRKGVTGLLLLQLLEMRLDTICFSLGLTPTIASARQLVNHGHILINGKKVDIPSFQCRKDDIISCLHFIGNKKAYYIKRFKIETNQSDRLFSFIDDSRGSKFIKATTALNPSLSFNYRLKSGDKREKI